MKTYHIITIGCQMNKSDSERLAGRLEQNDYKKTDNKYQADLIVVNTCGVRQAAEDRVYGLIPEIKKANKKAKVILTGCLAGREDVKNRLNKYVDEWLPIDKIFNFQINARCEGDYFKVKPKYESKFSAFVPIGNGCNNFCSYCVVPYARGREVYRPAEDVLVEVKNLVKKNYKEIILIAQNVNSYQSGKIDFAGLLKLANNIKGDFWIKFMTSHPKDMSDKLIKTMAECEKVCSYVHLPVQAGDDGILEKMNRKYTYKDYVSLIKKIRRAMPDSSITTDIIVGFPGETKKQFNNTAKLMRKVKFDLAYIAKYSVRQGTAAAKLPDNVSGVEKKRRELELMKILKNTALENNKKYHGKIVKVLVAGKNKRNELFGSTKTAKTVKVLLGDFDRRLLRSLALPRNDKLVGKFANIKITKAQDFGLTGEVINYEE